jgi:hypothetical protein
MRKGYDLTIASFILGTCLALAIQTWSAYESHKQTKIQERAEVHEQTK